LRGEFCTPNLYRLAASAFRRATKPNGPVLKLAASSATQTVLPLTGLNNPSGVAVDTAGNLYVTDGWGDRVLKLAAGSNAQSVLRSPASAGPRVWQWTPSATYTWSTIPTIGC
jgi:DNA-binding beta-propeller fold protein YncE